MYVSNMCVCVCVCEPLTLLMLCLKLYDLVFNTFWILMHMEKTTDTVHTKRNIVKHTRKYASVYI